VGDVIQRNDQNGVKTPFCSDAASSEDSTCVIAVDGPRKYDEQHSLEPQLRHVFQENFHPFQENTAVFLPIFAAFFSYVKFSIFRSFLHSSVVVIGVLYPTMTFGPTPKNNNCRGSFPEEGNTKLSRNVNFLFPSSG
jgi:hypothetical protein